MEKTFSESDIGRRIGLTLKVASLNPEFDEGEKLRVPYESIIKYKFIPKIRDSRKVLKFRDPRKVERINPTRLAQQLGAEVVTMVGYINKIEEKYFVIKTEEDGFNPSLLLYSHRR